MPERPILIAYDGSDYAKAAIEQAAEQLAAEQSMLGVTLWASAATGNTSRTARAATVF